MPKQIKNVKHSQNAMAKIKASNAKNGSKNPVIRRVNQQRPSGDQQSSFYNALADPFHPSSLGCQVPDPFPFPTATFHVHQTTVLGTNAVFGNTSGGIAFLPNPVLSMVDLQHADTLTSVNNLVTVTPFTKYSSVATNVASAIYGAVTPAALSSVYSDYRVVSWGIKISNLQPELSATGRMMVAMVPIGDTIPSYKELASATLAGALTPIFGIDQAYLNSSNILELPTGFEITVQDLLHGDLQIAGMYSNANFWTFKTSVTQGGPTLTTVAGDSASYNSAGSTVASVGYKDIVRCQGGAAIVLYVEGIPAGQPNAFQIETIYHLEGTPNFSSTANNALISSTGKKVSIGTSVGVELAMAKASKFDNAIHWLERGAQFLNDNRDTIVKIGSAAARYM